MRRAALHYVKLDRAHLAAEFLADKIFELLSDTGEVFVTEIVGNTGTGALVNNEDGIVVPKVY